MWYQFMELSDKQNILIQLFRDKFEELHKSIENDIDSSRGKSICLTKLEEASFWLNNWISSND